MSGFFILYVAKYVKIGKRNSRKTVVYAPVQVFMCTELSGTLLVTKGENSSSSAELPLPLLVARGFLKLQLQHQPVPFPVGQINFQPEHL